MADLSITPTSVLPGTTPVANYQGKFILGETVTAGMPVYLDTVVRKYFKAINTIAANTNGVFTYGVAGIALSGGAVGQPFHLQTSGQIMIGATVTAATEYYLSANAGGICPEGDIASGHRGVRIGYAETTDSLVIDIQDIGLKA